MLFCDESFGSCDQLIKHVSTACRFCGEHLCECTGEKPHACDICDKPQKRFWVRLRN